MSVMQDVFSFPLPGDAIEDGRTVIASVSAIADERGELALVLLLEKTAPYFTVGHYAITDFDPKLSGDPFLHGGVAYKAGEVDVFGRWWNIVNAVKHYVDEGGEPGGDD